MSPTDRNSGTPNQDPKKPSGSSTKPDFSNVRSGGSSTKPDFSNVRSGGSSTAPETPTSEPEVRTYVVVAGDSLSKIAKHVYGDGNQWRKIFEANRGILKDPDKIFPGQTLQLPE